MSKMAGPGSTPESDRRGRASLLTRLALYFFLLSSLVVAALGACGYALFVRQARRSVAAHIAALADLKAQSLERWIRGQAREVELLAELPGVRAAAAALTGAAGDPDSARRSLATVLGLWQSRDSAPEEITVLAPVGGLAVFSTRPEVEGEYRATASHFLEGRHRTYVQNVYPSPRTLRPTMTVSTPIAAPGGRLAGVLAVNLNLDAMDRIVQDRAGLAPGGAAFLVDSYNVFLSSRRFGTEEFPRGVHSRGIDAAIAGRDGVAVYTNHRRTRVVAAYRWIADREVALLVEVPTEEAYAAARRPALLLVAIGLFLVLLLAAGVYLLAFSITRPIVAVKEAALRVAAGDLDSRAPAAGRDEIGVLASAFNRMTGHLRELYQELRRREELFRSFFEEDLTGDYMASPEGAIISCNPAFARILGCSSPAEAQRHNLFSFYPGPRESQEFLSLLRERGRLEYFEKEMRTLQGAPIHVLENSIGQFDPQGRLIQVKGYLFDDSARKRLEERLVQAQKMEAVGRLAGGVAHDFNNLLTAILGYAELLGMEESISAAGSGHLEEIRRAAHRAASLTQQLLAYSRRQLLNPQVVDIAALVSPMEGMLRRLLGEEVALRVEVDSPVWARVDPTRLEQVVMNLVVNARDAVPQGGSIEISARARDVAAGDCERLGGLRPGRHAVLSVRDTGCGIARENLDRIFDPFFTTKEVGKGTGLGLSTVLGIVQQSGGHVEVKSRPGRGSTFTVYLPAEAPPEPEPAATAGEGVARGSRTVLVVEDEESVRRLICRVLRGAGYRVHAADGPQRALETAGEIGGAPQLLITDVVMPGMNGRELAERLLQRHPALRVLPWFATG